MSDFIRSAVCPLLLLFQMIIDTHPLQAVQNLLIYKSLGLPLISLNVCPLFRVNPAYKVLIAFQNLDSQRSIFVPFFQFVQVSNVQSPLGM